MDTRIPSNENPPRASLLGLPTELRLAIYDHVFGPFEHRQRRSLVYHDKSAQVGGPKPGLSIHVSNNGQEHWFELLFLLTGSAEKEQEEREHYTALFSVPWVCRQIRGELRNLVLEVPPISKICFMFTEFTKKDMERFVGAIGEDNTRHIRKWIMTGDGACHHRQYRDGHLFKGYHGGQGPCSFFEDGVNECNSRCDRLDPTYKTSKCRRRVTIELDKHEERDDRLRDIAPWKTVWRVDNVTAEDRLEKLRKGLGFEREIAKKALLMYRHVVYSTCWHPRGPGVEACYFSEPMDRLLNEMGEVEVSKRSLVGMLEAVMGES
ncbi:hypothetical protein PRZ48_004567 [Zasmidium cellare]|uniref:Uncharacterized protein n=1 Tax=Zasmidium cellare TaxID=395010 RepID=A0ABR0EQ64_ZASCE|nr:hypothetical protein PRZ48_004567 [Zasmidium cellare]